MLRIDDGADGRTAHREVPDRSRRTLELFDQASAPAPRDSSIGQRLGNYRLDELLAEGGMGRVYRATNTATGQVFALKQLGSQSARRPAAMRRFLSEASALGLVRHPNVVAVHELVTDAEAEPYYVMELLEGRDLATVIAEDGPLPWRRAVRIAMEVCTALTHVHRAGIVHRDLKPANVFLTARANGGESVKLIDFGIAAPMRAPATSEDGVLVGTPDFMPPEAIRGGAIDHRADIYALGVILYEMLAGASPFTARTFAETALKHLNHTPPRPSTAAGTCLPAELDALVMRCLEKDAADRPASAVALRQALGAIAAQRDRPYFASTVPARARRSARWLAVPAAAVAAAAMFLAGARWAGDLSHPVARLPTAAVLQENTGPAQPASAIRRRSP